MPIALRSKAWCASFPMFERLCRRQRPEELAALGNRAAQEGRLDEACDIYRQVLSKEPANLGVRAALSDLLFRRGDHAGAAAELERLLVERPDWADAHYNHGCALKAIMRSAEAEAAFRRALSLEPRHASAYRMLGGVLLGQSRTDEAVVLYAEARTQLPDDFDLESAELFALNSSERVSDAALFARHAEFGRRLEEAFPARFKFGNERDPDKRLRIGYVSGDFGYHVVTLFMQPVLEEHGFETYCYSTSERMDEYTRRIAAAAGVWRPAGAWSAAQLREAIHADAIDILVDLGGHSGIPQLRVFAQRPAPVQATWIGYLGSTGLKRIHYRITDAHADPAGLTERLHTETLVRLPHSQWCYRPFMPQATVSEPPMARNGHVTFGSFNSALKVSPGTRTLWRELLARVPDARLVVLAIPPGRAQEDLRRDLGDGDRVRVLPYVSLEDYFGWLQKVDIALDSTPYSGGTTTCDALWMGVPVLTAPGTRSASRSAASALTTARLTEWIATTPDDYVRRGVALSSDRPKLAGLRATLRARLQASPLMDEVAFTRDLEYAYREMWRRYCAAPQG